MSKRMKQTAFWICEEQFDMTLEEIMDSYDISQDILLEMIAEGVIEAKQDRTKKWLFDHEALKIIQKVLRLTEDLGINRPGAYLAIELIEEINKLQDRLNKHYDMT